MFVVIVVVVLVGLLAGLVVRSHKALDAKLEQDMAWVAKESRKAAYVPPVRKYETLPEPERYTGPTQEERDANERKAYKELGRRVYVDYGNRV